MIANGWKTAEQVQADYQISPASFKRLKATCLESKYSDAVVLVGGKTYVIEDKWQQFLIYLSSIKKAGDYGSKTTRKMRVIGDE